MQALPHPVFAAGLLGLGLGLGLPPAGHAVERGELDRARQVIDANEIQPLATVLARIAPAYQRQVVEAELRRSGERWIYEIKLLPASGSLRELRFDARTGALLQDDDLDEARSRGGERGREREGR